MSEGLEGFVLSLTYRVAPSRRWVVSIDSDKTITTDRYRRLGERWHPDNVYSPKEFSFMSHCERELQPLLEKLVDSIRKELKLPGGDDG